ncbi:pleiotropic regulatory protein RsmS [Vibrio mimicus]|uniref:pleiotropic regulatory protein RsmS n=1 Tax=Vibrio sp. RC586 TaxID=675815 RepID=UPI0001BB8708|nr:MULTISPECIES: pleiotropic regulatory protein RsmS [Vibrio]EEY98371.1 hypothetical protein VOA_002191 [Vibrio sp. RC586]QXC58582.1 pleiotropic regulatory protein RsmS [Vibrio mimicus]
MSNPSIPLNEASDEIKLAVDLIYLLESHAIEPQLALAAIEIVKRDLEHRLADDASITTAREDHQSSNVNPL